MTSTIGRYVARLLLSRFGVVLLGLSALMLILEFFADSDQLIAATDDVAWTLALYTVLRLPGILIELIPIAALLAGLLTFTELARHSELTAIHASGLSKARLARAVLPVASLICAFQLIIEDQARPAAVRELRAWGVGGYGDEDDAVWLRRGGDIVRVREVDAEEGELRGVTIFRRDEDGNFVAKVQAGRALVDGGSWTLLDVTRSAVGSSQAESRDRLTWSDGLAPANLGFLVTNPREMSFVQLLRLVRRPELGSQPAFRYEVWLHERLAGPITTGMLILLTVALSRPPLGRAAQGALVAIGIGLGFLLWTFDGVVLNFGDLGLIPPALAAWTPVPVIAAIALSVALQRRGTKGKPAPAPARAAGR